MKKRVFLIVLDSVGAGEAPDAADFGDAGAHTLRSVFESRALQIPNLLSLGLSRVDGLSFLGEAGRGEKRASALRLREVSRGKDTTIGHWEIAGVVSKEPLPTYPEGFPKEVLDAFSEATGRGVLCNLPYSGTDVIRDYGEEHLKTGKLIVYTSADSVFQIAAHEELVPVETLYEYCKMARKILTGKHGVGRVIARPFTGEPGVFARTPRRHDFSLEAPTPTLLDNVKEAGKEVIAVGKISDIFASRGVTETIYTSGNDEGIEVTKALVKRDFDGLCFVNLVDFDMLYGHRNDAVGYAKALSAFDKALPEILTGLAEDDLLVITADHGCDPGDISTDHTREYTPCLFYRKGSEGKNLGTEDSFATIAATVADFLAVPYHGEGKSLLAEVT